MTSEELRALDVEIHTKVMGEQCYWDACTEDWCNESDLSRDATGERFKVAIPAYSTEIAAAWLVLERLQVKRVRVEVNDSGRHTCSILAGRAGRRPLLGLAKRDGFAVAETVPLAICLAALMVTKEPTPC